MSRVFITGDTHGEFSRIRKFVENNNTTLEDILIILGDAGINYYLGEKDIKLKKELSQLPITLFCIHGNHEARPTNIESYKEVLFLDGIVYQEEAYPNLLFAKDGEVFNFLGHKTLVIGGAYSVDKYYRLLRGYSWFSDEQPSEETKSYVEKKIKENQYKFDIVLTHTCPINEQPRHLFLGTINQSTVDDSTEIWLQSIANKIEFNHWYYGHYHGEYICGKFRLFFNDIIELNTKESD